MAMFVNASLFTMMINHFEYDYLVAEILAFTA